MPSNQSIEETISSFKSQLLILMPFYGDILLRLPILRDDSITPACTDGRSIRWSNRFFSKLSEPEIRYVLMHEVFHVLLKHSLRMKGKKKQIWNVAADAVVNTYCDSLAAFLKNTGIPLESPFDAIHFDYKYRYSLENLYEKLLHDNPSYGGYQHEIIYKSTTRGKKDQFILLQEDLYPGNMSGDPLTPEEEKKLERFIDRMISDAQSHDRGTSGSYFIPRDLLTITKAKSLDWRRLLKEFLSEVRSDDTSYTTPERKYLHMDMILPGHGLSEEGELESVWAFVDSSGSVGKDDLNAFLTELCHIVKQFQCEMNIAYWDTQVTDVYKKIRRKDQIITAQPKHSGGTDINCVYRYVRAKKLKPAVSLILTDGFFGNPDPVLSKSLPAKNTILLLCNSSQDPVYQKVGRVCRLQNS